MDRRFYGELNEIEVRECFYASEGLWKAESAVRDRIFGTECLWISQ
jgi:hypothetical protein